MSENTFILNGQAVEFQPGQTILEAAEVQGVRIPTLCHLKHATPTGVCRICVVEVEGLNKLPTACNTPVAEGMKVLTESPKVVNARKMILELMLASGNHNCAAMSTTPADWTEFQLRVQSSEGTSDLCPVWGDCRLQDLVFQYQVELKRYAPPKSHSLWKWPVL